MRRSHVLLVEDDDDMRTLYGFTLANAGFKVRAVKNGLEALVELQVRLPDVIVESRGGRQPLRVEIVPPQKKPVSDVLPRPAF
jgi:DNA-binding NtrC family response regulator